MDDTTFGNFKAAILLAQQIKDDRKLRKKVHVLLQRFRIGLKQIQSIVPGDRLERNIRMGLLVDWRKSNLEKANSLSGFNKTILKNVICTYYKKAMDVERNV